MTTFEILGLFVMSAALLYMGIISVRNPGKFYPTANTTAFLANGFGFLMLGVLFSTMSSNTLGILFGFWLIIGLLPLLILNIGTALKTIYNAYKWYTPPVMREHAVYLSISVLGVIVTVQFLLTNDIVSATIPALIYMLAGVSVDDGSALTMLFFLVAVSSIPWFFGLFVSSLMSNAITNVRAIRNDSHTYHD